MKKFSEINFQNGDDFYSLAEKHLGDHKLWRYISSCNDLGVFDEIRENTKIKIPNQEMLGEIAASIGDKDFKSLAASAIPQILDLSGVKAPSGITKKAYQLIDWLI